MRKFFTVALAALCSVPMMSQVSFSSVIDLALRNSPRVKMAEADVKRTQAVLQQSVDVYIPALTGGSGLGYTYGFPVGTPTLFNFTLQSLGFDMSQRNYIRAAHHGYDAAKLSLKDVKQQVAQDAASTYISIENDQRRVKALTEQYGYADRLTALVQERLDAGQDTKIELTRSRLTAAQVRLRRLQITDDLQQQREHLSLLTGLPGAEIVADASTIPDAPTFTVSRGELRVSYAVLAADANAQSKLQQAFGDARKMYRPQVVIVAQYNRFAAFNGYDQYYNNYKPNNFSLGIQLTMPIFDFNRRARARESMADAQKSLAEAKLARNTAGEHQLKDATLVDELNARTEVSQLERELASNQLEVVQVQIAKGNPNGQPMTPKDEQNARIEERAKYLQYLEADLQLKQAQVELLRTAGQLEDWIQTSVKTSVQSKP